MCNFIAKFGSTRCQMCFMRKFVFIMKQKNVSNSPGIKEKPLRNPFLSGFYLVREMGLEPVMLNLKPVAPQRFSDFVAKFHCQNQRFAKNDSYLWPCSEMSLSEIFV